jgi:DNA helicase II / ATP-dependent DNA helicase PcrA
MGPRGSPAGGSTILSTRVLSPDHSWGSTKPSHPFRIVTPVDADNLLDGLTDAQRAAVETTAAPLCIQAGAGAGKTRVLAQRIAHRVAVGSADPGHVLALTFTRKAASELTGRLQALGVRDRVATGTFHGVAYAQLRQYWRDRGEPAPTLLDSKARLLGRLAPGRPEVADAPIALLAAEIEWAQARSIDPAGYESAATEAGRRPPVSIAALASLFARYETEKRRCRLADFDDLLARCAQALESDPAFGAAQRWRWRHLFVDEFQDVNPLQYRLLAAWLGASADLCVVGDPNQAIYGWNGADPDLLRHFDQHWPGATVVRLDVNHRCSPQVVAAAAAVLGSSGSQLRSTRPDGPAPAIRAYPTDQAEAEGVATELRRAHANGLRWSQMAVLMRTNGQTASFEAALRAAKVPYQLASGAGLLEHRAVREVLAALRTCEQTPFSMTVADLSAGAAGHDQPPSDDQAGDRAALAGLLGLARSYQAMDDGSTTGGFLKWLGAVRRGVDRDLPAMEAVTVGSFHRAKGLEWPAVWVTGLEQGLVPISYAIASPAAEEERRLLYVALTRAERELHCSWSEARQLGGRLVPREPSPWLDAVASSIDATSDFAAPGAPESWQERLVIERERLRRTRRPPAFRLPTGLPEPDPAVVESLQAWRARAARAASVPASVLLHDRTLWALAAAEPATLEDLLAVPGIGGVKASRYGDALLAAVAVRRISA